MKPLLIAAQNSTHVKISGHLMHNRAAMLVLVRGIIRLKVPYGKAERGIAAGHLVLPSGILSCRTSCPPIVFVASCAGSPPARAFLHVKVLMQQSHNAILRDGTVHLTAIAGAVADSRRKAVAAAACQQGRCTFPISEAF